MRWIVILANYENHFIRVHENLVQHPSDNIPMSDKLLHEQNTHCTNMTQTKHHIFDAKFDIFHEC